MNIRSVGPLLTCWLSLAAVVHSATFSPEEVRRDLKFLYETLQASHYDLFAHTPKADYDRAYQQAYDAITHPMDDLETYRTLQPFVVLAGMAHCNIGLPFQTVYVPYVMKGGTAIPFDLTFSGDKTFIWHNYSDQGELSPGTEIMKIGGTPVAEVLVGIYRFVSGDSSYLKRTNIELTGFPRLYWLAYGEKKKFTVTLRKADGADLELELDAVPALQFEQKAAANKALTNPGREIRFIGDVAYLHPGVFLNNQSPADISAHEAFDKGEFMQFLDGAFREIREKKSGSLVIDLRGNPGGDNSFSDPMIAYVASRAFRFCSSFEVRTSQVTKDFWAGVSDAKLATLKAAILTHENGRRFKADIPQAEPRPVAERFHGRVFVLVDRFSFSNAVTTAAIFQDFKFGVLVGETTADIPTTYGAAHQFDLPHTHLTVMYPKAFMVRPSGETAARGVRPEHAVSDNVFTEEDEALQQAIALANGPT